MNSGEEHEHWMELELARKDEEIQELKAEIEELKSGSGEEKKIESYLYDMINDENAYTHYKLLCMKELGYVYMYLTYSDMNELSFGIQRDKLHLMCKQFEKLDRLNCSDKHTWVVFYDEITDEFENLC